MPEGAAAEAAAAESAPKRPPPKPWPTLPGAEGRAAAEAAPVGACRAGGGGDGGPAPSEGPSALPSPPPAPAPRSLCPARLLRAIAFILSRRLGQRLRRWTFTPHCAARRDPAHRPPAGRGRKTCRGRIYAAAPRGVNTLLCPSYNAFLLGRPGIVAAYLKQPATRSHTQRRSRVARQDANVPLQM